MSFLETSNGKSARLLIVEDDSGLGNLLREEAEDAGLAVRLAHSAEQALPVVTAWAPDVMVSDLRLPGADGLTLLKQVREALGDRAPDVLIVTAFGNVARAVESLKAGAEDFLTKPLDLEHFMLTIRRVLEKRRLRGEIRQMKNLMEADGAFHGMHGRSPAMASLFEQIRRLGRAEGPVLIAGESGSGKELVARAIHEESERSSAPFLAVNCAGIPETLLESEFFGHAAGAFTGAGKSRPGLFAEADGGVLLLDEIAEMPLALQAKLLRVLQDGLVRPVGGDREREVDVRILAATNRDLEACVREGAFREDLFYRLETFALHVPPLREREEDVDVLAGIFLAKHAMAAGKRIRGLSLRTQEALRDYPFPGNVRELNNAMERAVVYCPGEEIRPEHLPARIRRRGSSKGLKSGLAACMPVAESDNPETLPTLEDVVKSYIRHVLKKTGGNKRSAASILGIARRTLYRRLDDARAEDMEG